MDKLFKEMGDLRKQIVKINVACNDDVSICSKTSGELYHHHNVTDEQWLIQNVKTRV